MSQLLSDLPSEIVTYIFDFLINAEYPPIRQLLILELICNKISKQQAIRSYFEDIWKSLLLKQIPNEGDRKEFHKMEKLLRKKTFRRVYCILSAELRGNCKNNPCRNPTSSGEYKVLMFGCGGAGKSSLTIRFYQGNFITEY